MLVPIMALIFLTALCGFLALYLFLQEKHSSPRTELRRRLQHLGGGRTGEVPLELRCALTREAGRAREFITRLPLAGELAKKLDRAGMRISVPLFVALTVSGALFSAATVALQTGSILPGGVAVATVLLLVHLLLKQKTQRRTNRFTELFPDAMSIIARSLRAGHSFSTAIQLVGEEVPSPVGPLFRTAYEQQQLGLRMADALIKMNERMDSLDLRLFTTVITINTDIGGNLSDLLDKLAVTIRERLKIRRQVQVYTAQGRLSGYVLGALPLVVFGVFGVLNPEYEMVLIKEPMGIYILVFALVMQIVGFVVIRNIIRIRI